MTTDDQMKLKEQQTLRSKMRIHWTGTEVNDAEVRNKEKPAEVKRKKLVQDTGFRYFYSGKKLL
ncbi:hypothetical protein SAMN06265348_102159 [Pedobacter westerhofensis]|uniref:Uncharacterized protein n=1 Tax=Pedobacter westerhofensis TaxID=425512 RepID=A0A521BBA2_9SPHI|nr:hypothetical protein [Pedobacter westerhofensis]SMO44365.1 hypothetical protein SAMN06265348_102159 [Pedobacter westerhofensis]